MLRFPLGCVEGGYIVGSGVGRVKHRISVRLGGMGSHENSFPPSCTDLERDHQESRDDAEKAADTPAPGKFHMERAFLRLPLNVSLQSFLIESW